MKSLDCYLLYYLSLIEMEELEIVILCASFTLLLTHLRETLLSVFNLYFQIIPKLSYIIKIEKYFDWASLT